MSKAKLAVLVGIASVVLLGLFIKWGGFFQPPFLTNCPPDEMRLSFYSSDLGGGNELITINLRTRELSKTWHQYPEDHFLNTSHFMWDKVPPLYTEEQIAQVKKALESLSEPSASLGKSVRNQSHLAFWKGGQLHIYHYNKGQDWLDLERLLTLCEVPPHFLRE